MLHAVLQSIHACMGHVCRRQRMHSMRRHLRSVCRGSFEKCLKAVSLQLQHLWPLPVQLRQRQQHRLLHSTPNKTPYVTLHVQPQLHACQLAKTAI